MITDTLRPSEDEIIQCIAQHFDCPEAVALSWLTSVFQDFNPRQAAERLCERQGATQ